MLGLRRLHTGEWNKPPVLTAATALIMRRLAQLHGQARIKDLAVIHNGQGLKKGDRDENGPYPVYAAGGRVGNHSERLTATPFVVIGRKGSAGKPTFAPGGGWVIDTAYYAQPRDSGLSCKFLYYALEACDFSGDIIATAIPGINRTAVYKHLIPSPPQEVQAACTEFLDALEQGAELPPLPGPLSEQRRIVAKIEQLAAKIDEARGLKERTASESERFWKVLSRMARSTESPSQPLDEMAEFLDGRRVPLSKAQRASRQGPYPYYGASRIIDYLDDYLFDEPLVLLSEDGANLINRSTPIAFIATGKYWVNNHAHVLRPRPGVDMRFLTYALSDYDVSEFNFASAQAKLNQRNAKRIAFPLPDLDEQRRIVAYLDDLQAKVDRLKTLQAQTAAELDALLPSILDKAFKGEL